MYSRQLIRLQRGYNSGNETIQSISQELTHLSELLSNHQTHMNTVNELAHDSPGQLISRVYIPKGGYIWNRVILDEADTIPISNARPFLSHMTWMVSASYLSFLYPFTSPPPHRRGYIRDVIES